MTICTKDRVHRFGEIVDEQMNENDLAVIVRTCWDDLSNHYLNVQLDEFVIMPNHVHGIVMIVDEPNTVGDGLRPSPTKRRPLSEIVRAFKSFSARRINEINGTPGAPFWQRGYYDHIIRNDRSLTRIREYIANNPQQWWTDRENFAYEGNDELEGWMPSNGTNHFQDATR